MAHFMHTVRFVLGMAMLASGAVLVQPFAAVVLGGGHPVPARAGVAAGPGVPAGGSLPAAAIGPGGHAIPDVMQAAAAPAGEPMGGASPPAAPPPPPAPLPESVLEWAAPAPSLDGTYRSTVEIPPPPLLDAHAPPPLAAGLTAHDVARPVGAMPQPPQERAVPATYVVRDGDDLTGIALRVYGHAGAATAIWSANSDRLADPELLPIGLALRLPPTWMLPAVRGPLGAGSAGAIEPSVAGGGLAVGQAAAPGRAVQPTGTQPVGTQPVGPAAEPAPARDRAFWLRDAGVSNPSGAAAPGFVAAKAPPESPAARARPALIRVGLGDSFESLAVRYYGDKAAAARIWQANRDRVRSPELLVPGSELRLP